MPVLSNPQHETFVHGLADGLSRDAAYQAAGFGNSRANASRLAAKPEIKARLAEIMGAAAERVEITQAMVLAELAKIGFSDIRKLFGPGGALKRVEDLDDETAAFVSSVKVVTRRLPGGGEGEVEHVAEIKQWDKLSALEKIGKHIGMFKEAPVEAPVVNFNIGDQDLARLIVFQLTKASKEA
jgi:phage terminase small subunit